MKRKKRTIAAVFVALCIAICALILTRNNPHLLAFSESRVENDIADHKDPGNNPIESNSKTAKNHNSKTNEGNTIDAELLQSTVTFLKQSELKRFKYARKLENDKRILHEFLIESPTGNDLINVNRSISKIKGVTTDSNGKPIEIRQLLAEQYSNASGFRYQVVTVTFPKNGDSKPRYSVLGIRDGNLKTRDDGSAFPIDGKMNFLAFGTTFDSNGDWRYSHLFEKE